MNGCSSSISKIAHRLPSGLGNSNCNALSNTALRIVSLHETYDKSYVSVE